MNYLKSFSEYADKSFAGANRADSLVLVGMSGGVDSSVTAALMRLAGFKVVGVTLQLSQSEKKIRSCCSEKDIQDAVEVAQHMNFPHYTLDYADRFAQHVVQDFIGEYQAGYTPSPCVRCNQKIKFGDLLEFAKKLKADYVIMGHYIIDQVINQEVSLHRPKDLSKDQTYFMSLVSKENLPFMRFPLGIFTKSEVRAIAEELGLAVAKKSDSQDLCFVQNGSYRDILKQMASKANKGIIVNRDEEIVGYHEGIQNYTVGQRKGIEVPNGPWFVVKIVAEENKIIIGTAEDLLRTSFSFDSLNLLTSTLPDTLMAQVRARQAPIPCKIDLTNNTVVLESPTHSIAGGQICAFYSSDRLIGGARII